MQHLEAVIKSRIPSILAMINKMIDEIETELNQIGRPLSNDAGVSVLWSSIFLLFFIVIAEVWGGSVKFCERSKIIQELINELALSFPMAGLK